MTEKMLSSPAFFKLLVESSTDALSVHRVDGSLLYASPACEELYGYATDAFRGEGFLKEIHEADRAALIAFFQAMPGSGKAQATTFRIRHSKGYLIWIEAACRRIDDPEQSGNSLILVSARNVTARKLDKQQRDKMSGLLSMLNDRLHERSQELRETEKQLVQAQKLEAIGQLAGGIAHDFNNLLSGMIGFSEAIESEAVANPSIADKAARIHQAAGRGMELTKKILSFARINSAKRSRESFNDIVREAQGLLQRTIPKVVTMDLHLQRDLWELSCDRSEMIQILLNLGINAKDAMEDCGKISIRTENVECCSERWIRIEFEDTGSGMSQEVMDRIFVPFFTTKEVGKGTGLGLSVVYGIVQSHQGTIEVSSVIGKGSRFTISLPALSPDVSALEKPEAPTFAVPVGRLTASFNGRTALVIDDDDIIRELSEDYLGDVGFNLLSAADGAEALSLFQEHLREIDLVVLDLNLPEKSGHQVFSEIRSKRPELPVISFSGFSKEQSLEILGQDSRVTALEKPCTREEYLEAVKIALELKRA